jgi:putative addiction module CopG family antidote
MNISLTKDLEEYVAGQLETGHYASASEVIREALRNQIKSSVNSQLLDERMALGRQQVEEGKFTVADDSYFDKARDYVKGKYMSNPA